jgi:hypothetical protein
MIDIRNFARVSNNVTSLHSNSRINSATYCDKAELNPPEEVKRKTTEHGSSIDHVIRQEASPAGSALQLEDTAYSMKWRQKKDSATRRANVR